jgi:hypothetical protein
VSDTEPEDSGRFFPRVDKETRKQALAEPGPSWREYFYYSFAKVWTVLAFFIIDSFDVVTFAVPFNPAAIVGTLILVVYAEFLLYEYLWHRPSEPVRGRLRQPFHATWYRPFPYGRWTEEADLIREGRATRQDIVDSAPDPEEFL